MTSTYSSEAPSPEQVAALEGPVVLDFGTDWCGHCRASQPLVATALEQQPDVRHIKVEDGKGRRLGRAYRVRLWPTLIFLKDGMERARLVRPANVGAISDAMAQITAE